MRNSNFRILVFIFLLSAMVPAFAQPADSPWPMFRHDPQHTGRSQYIGPEHPELKWRIKVDNAIYSSPAIGLDGTIYFGSGYLSHGYLYAVNPNGSLKWSFYADTYSVFTSPAVGSDGTIYFGTFLTMNLAMSHPHLYAINPDGTLKWQFSQLSEGIQSSPNLGPDGTIYFGDLEGNFFAVSPDGNENWCYDTEGSIISSPALGEDGTIYFSSIRENFNLSNFYALDNDGFLKWSFLSEGGSYSSPAVGDDGTIYTGFINYSDGGIVAFEPDGTLKWSFLCGETASSPAIGADGTIYFCANKEVGEYLYTNQLYAVNPDGTEKWKVQFGGDYFIDASPSIGADGTIYVGSSTDTLYAFDLSGNIKWTYQASGYIFVNPVITSDKTLYFGTTQGNFYALKDADPIEFALNIEPEGRLFFEKGDRLEILLDVQTHSEVKADIYFVMHNGATDELLFGMSWNNELKTAIENLTLPDDLSLSDVEILEVTIPSEELPTADAGEYTFAIAATEPGTLNFISNIATVSFEVTKLIE